MKSLHAANNVIIIAKSLYTVGLGDIGIGDSDYCIVIQCDYCNIACEIEMQPHSLKSPYDRYFPLGICSQTQLLWQKKLTSRNYMCKMHHM